MSPPRCPEPLQGAAEIPIPGQWQAGSDPQFVGRTSVPAAGRALVPTTALRANQTGGARRPVTAAFLAQLIATAQQAPQTRSRRRTDPDHACAVYRDRLAGIRDQEAALAVVA
jgi:hypothetical protein